MNSFIIFTLIYQLLIVLLYNKAARIFTYINKLLYIGLILIFVYLMKFESSTFNVDLRYIVPILFTCLLFLIYDTNKGFAQYSIRNKFFPILVAFVVLVSQLINIDVVNYAIILSASYDFLITTERKNIGSSKRFLGPIFILTTQLIGLVFNFGIENDFVFLIYWIITSKLFPFSLLKNKNVTIDENYLTRSILILSLAFGGFVFSTFTMVVFSISILLTLVSVFISKKEIQSFISYRSIILSVAILISVLSNKINGGVIISSLLWLDFYFMALAFSRIKCSLPDRLYREVGNLVFFLLLTGAFIGANHFIIGENLKVLFLNGQINLALLLICPILIGSAGYFSRKNREQDIDTRVRKIDHFDTFISQLIIIIGVILSV